LAFTTDALVALIRDRAQVPDSGTSTAFGSTDQEILNLAHQVATTRLIPAIRSVRENYLAAYQDTALVANDASVAVPRDAQGSAVQHVALLDSNSRPLPLFEVELGEWTYLDPNATGRPSRFYIEGDIIRLWPTVAASGDTLRVRYFRRLSSFVPVSSCYPVSSVTNSTTFVVTGSPGATFDETGIDVVQVEPPFRVLVDDNAANLVTSTFTLAGSATTAGIAAGDYVCLHMETCVPQLPAEMHSVLVGLTAAALLRKEGDREGYAAEQAEALAELERVTAMLENRADKAPNFIINRSSPLRGNRRRVAWWTGS
jgi:hypothetical protein